MRVIFLSLMVCLSLAAAGVNSNSNPPRPSNIAVLPTAWEHFYNNEYDAAIKDFEATAAANPKSADAQNHLAQALLYRELFRNGALESQLVTGSNPFLRSAKLQIEPGIKNRFFLSIDRSLALTQAALAKNENDVPALYAAGVAHGLRANYSFLVEKSWTESLKDATAARKDHERVLEIDPKFIDAYLILGLDDYIVGSLPFFMKAFGFMAGIHGSKDSGIEHLELVRMKGNTNRFDAAILLAVLYRREDEPRKAIPLLKDLSARFARNYLLKLELAQMYSDLGNKAAALAAYDNVERFCRTSASPCTQVPYGKIEYLRGNLLFWYGDLPGAKTQLASATDHVANLDLNTAQLAWMRRGQVSDLMSDHDTAKGFYERAVAVAPSSTAGDEAKHYLDHPYRNKRK